ncbi:MAG: hydrogenase/urease accessory protein HupE [Bradymonadia bacterium]|jgi:hydrogenase/urease accessory protein HupE
MIAAGRLAVFSVLLGLLTVASPAAADQFAPLLLDMQERSPGTFAVLWKLPAANNSVPDVSPRFAEACNVITEHAHASPTSLSERFTLDCADAGLRGQRIVFDGLDDGSTEVIVRVAFADETEFTSVVRSDEREVTIPAVERAAGTFVTYVRLGFEHILGGADHLAFVLALMLIVRGRRVLLTTVTAFTVGHSVTLAAVSLTALSVPSGPVEAVIALSIVLLAAEAASSRRDTLTIQRPWLIAGGFGLIHGLGFAGALREIGLPVGHVPAALASFNVGVELGQLAFVCCVLVVSLPLRRAEVWQKRARLAAAYGVGGMATAWFFERMSPIFTAYLT